MDGGASKCSGKIILKQYITIQSTCSTHTVLCQLCLKKVGENNFENKKETCVISSESIKVKCNTLQCHKFKCYSAGEEEGLLTHWSPAQGCLLWAQQLVGTRLAFTSARRTGSLQALTILMSLAEEITKDFFFSPIYYHFSLCLFKTIVGC